MTNQLIRANILSIYHWSNVYAGYLVINQEHIPLHHIQHAISYLLHGDAFHSQKHQKMLNQINTLVEQLMHPKVNRYGDLQTDLLANPVKITRLAHYLYYDLF